MKNHLVIHWIITNFPMNNSQCDIIREHDSIIISNCQNLKVGEWSKELVSWAYCPTLWIKAEHVWHAPENVCRASIPISSLRIFSVLSPSSLWTFECIPFLACLPLSLVDDAEELSQSRGILRIALLPVNSSTAVGVPLLPQQQQQRTFQVMNRNARKAKRANHGKRPCSRIRRRYKVKKWANTCRKG